MFVFVFGCCALPNPPLTPGCIRLSTHQHKHERLYDPIVGLTASCFGLGATLSNFFGQLAVEKLGHAESLLGSLALSIIPVIVFGCFMPETMGRRGCYATKQPDDDRRFDGGADGRGEDQYVQMT